MRNAFTFRSASGRHRPVKPGAPASGDIHGGIIIGVESTTGCTGEYVAAPSSQHATSGAGLAGGGRFNVFDLNTAPLGFVGHKCLKLAERPAGHHPVGVLVEDLASLSDARKPFHPDHSGLCAFGFGNDGLTEVVVLPGDTSAFASTLPAQRDAGAAIVS